MSKIPLIPTKHPALSWVNLSRSQLVNAHSNDPQFTREIITNSRKIYKALGQQWISSPYAIDIDRSKLEIQDIDVHDRVKDNYDSSVLFREDDQFWYAWNHMGGKYIHYDLESQFWFCADIFHMLAHAVNHQQESRATKKISSYPVASFAAAKGAWIKAHEMLDLFHRSTGENLIRELTVAGAFTAYANLSLLSWFANKDVLDYGAKHNIILPIVEDDYTKADPYAL